jgi:hypothetical protein
MKRLALFVVSFGLASCINAADWTVYRVTVPNQAAAERLAESGIAVVSCEIGRTTEVAAPNERQLRGLGMPYKAIGTIGDPNQPFERYTDGSNYQTEFLRYDEIIAQYEQWRAAYPTIITREQIGTSLQNRPVWVYRLRNPYAAVPPTGVLIQGGIHAREWLSPPTVMYITDMMLKDGLNSAMGWDLLTRYELSVVPVVNPDGYEYTWTNYRLWRKNRRDVVGSSQFGVDLNRNYAKGWGGPGSSGNPGSDTYRGTAAFSEPEVDCIRDYLDVRSTTVPYAFIIDFHTHGQKILYPWSYIETPAPHDAQLNAIGNVYRGGILSSTGFDYEVGQGSVALYVASGSSKDFYYDAYGAMAYTVEMRAGGQSGFEPPPTTILPNAMENYAGFKAVLIDML